MFRKTKRQLNEASLDDIREFENGDRFFLLPPVTICENALVVLNLMVFVSERNNQSTQFGSEKHGNVSG